MDEDIINFSYILKKNAHALFAYFKITLSATIHQIAENKSKISALNIFCCKCI